MKLEVIGWTYDCNRRYPDHKGDGGAVLRAVVNALRAGGYKFGGNTHQDSMTGTPVLNDGTKACYSWRGWGGVMAKALELSNEKGFAYMSWYMDTIEVMLGGPRREIVEPPWGVDESRIVKRVALAEDFALALSPEAFDAVAAGKKTVELRPYDEEHECICRGDYIDFFCGERRCRTHVTRVEIFEIAGWLFEERSTFEEERAHRHRMSLVRRACFGGCNTAEAVRAYLQEQYPPEKNKRQPIMAISFKKV